MALCECSPAGTWPAGKCPKCLHRALVAERDALRARAEKAERERDEARNEARRLAKPVLGEPRKLTIDEIENAMREGGCDSIILRPDGMAQSADYSLSAKFLEVERRAESAERERDEARASREAMDCRFAGPFWESSGSHCENRPERCQRCRLEAAEAALALATVAWKEGA